MVYGELGIYLADGTVNTHDIEKETTAIGRSPGNDIVLPTSSASRYHAHISVGERRVVLVDLGTVNGTFVDDDLLQPNGSVELTGNEEIRIGDVRIVFRPAEGVIAPRESSADQTQVAVSTPSSLRVTLEEPNQTVAPGARMQLILTIENPQEKPRGCKVELSGMDAKWARSNRYEVHLEGFEKTEVVISVSPPRGTDTHPGEYTLAVAVTADDEPENVILQSRAIRVVEYHGLGMVVQPGDRPEVYVAYVQNQGNVAANVALDGWHPQDALKYKFDKSRLELAPGETQQVRVRVQPRRKADVVEGSLFAVVARSLGSSGYQASVPVIREVAKGGGGGVLFWPIFLGAVPLWMLTLLGSLLAITGLMGLLFFSDERGILRPARSTAQPSPTSPPATTYGLSSPTAPLTPFPAPTLVIAALDPSELVRYQQVAVFLRYAVETAPGPAPEELSLALIDASTGAELRRFTVIDFQGAVDMSVLMGENWLDELYGDGGRFTYSLHASVRNSGSTSSAPIDLIIHPLDCSVRDQTIPRAGPGNIYPAADPLLAQGESYWPIMQANVNNVVWYNVGPGESQRWLLADDLNCTLDRQIWEPSPSFRFFELDAIPPTPAR